MKEYTGFMSRTVSNRSRIRGERIWLFTLLSLFLLSNIPCKFVPQMCLISSCPLMPADASESRTPLDSFWSRNRITLLLLPWLCATKNRSSCASSSTLHTLHLRSCTVCHARVLPLPVHFTFSQSNFHFLLCFVSVSCKCSMKDYCLINRNAKPRVYIRPMLLLVSLCLVQCYHVLYRTRTEREMFPMTLVFEFETTLIQSL